MYCLIVFLLYALKIFHMMLLSRCLSVCARFSPYTQRIIHVTPTFYLQCFDVDSRCSSSPEKSCAPGKLYGHFYLIIMWPLLITLMWILHQDWENFTTLCEGRSAFFLLMGKFGMCDLYAPTWGRMHQLEGESWVDYNKHMKVHWEFTIIRNSSISSHCIILSEWFTLIVNVMTCFLSIHIALLRLCVVPINFEGKCKRNK